MGNWLTYTERMFDQIEHFTSDKDHDIVENLYSEIIILLHEIQEKLKEIGQEDVDQQKLFEIFFQNEELTNTLVDRIYSNADDNFQKLSKRKSDLFKELDNMLIEIYHTSPFMIDEMRMIAAEEGCLCHFDLEHVKKGVKGGNFDTTKIPSKAKQNLLKRMDEVLAAA